MFPFPHPWSMLTRALALTLLSGALLLAPRPMDVAQAAACSNGVGGISLVDVTNPPSRAMLKLHFTMFHPNGEPRVRGVLLDRLATPGINTSSPPAVLVARGAAQVECDDQNADGFPGITALRLAAFQPSGEEGEVILTSEHEIDASGPYTIQVTYDFNNRVVTTAEQVFVTFLGKSKPSDEVRAKGGNADKGEPGKRRR